VGEEGNREKSVTMIGKWEYPLKKGVTGRRGLRGGYLHQGACRSIKKRGRKKVKVLIG